MTLPFLVNCTNRKFMVYSGKVFLLIKFSLNYHHGLLHFSNFYRILSENSFSCTQNQMTLLSYRRLISVIASELDIDQVKKNIDVRYIVDENMASMVIRNDNGIKVYVELKKIFIDFVMYPLCITTRDKSTEDREFDVETGTIMCVDGMESDASALAVVDSNNQYALYVSEIETSKFITDCHLVEILRCLNESISILTIPK
ncbi:uncharacterized protein LOC107842930 [Capsicum annuum]|uniref:uncharacterized protein LOC107842930 n=1 Tax=Capsicum annuum TaxID=4072 RepID=UPI001FB10428|nr:uncharacterized protein LOC107842930 [Capsicum annuum]